MLTKSEKGQKIPYSNNNKEIPTLSYCKNHMPLKKQ
jgi:hypothetical protein